MNANYNDAIHILQQQWAQADLDQRAAIGDTQIWNQIIPGFAESGRHSFNFNIINPMVQVISGYQRRNRKSSICIPVHSPMQKTADQLTKCLYHVHKNGAYQVYSDCFEQGAITQGIGLCSIFPDYTENPSSPDIRLRYVDFKSIILDPYFKRHDLSDCRFIWTRQYFDKREAAELYPDFKDRIMSSKSLTSRDDKFYYMPEMYQIQTPNLLAVDEYWYLSTRKALYLVDTYTDEAVEFIGTKKDFDIYAYTNKSERLKLEKRPKQTVRRTILVNDRILSDEEAPYGIDRYPYVPFLGYFTPDTPYFGYKFRGVVRDARDAQYLFTRRKIADLDYLEAQQQGLIVKEGTLTKPEDSLNSGNGRVLTIKKHAQMTDVQPMEIRAPDPTMVQMSDQLQVLAMKIVGVNEEMMGSAVDDKAGILAVLRQGAGLTSLQRLFDQCDEAQRLCGDIIIEMIQKNWTYNKIKSVIGEDPTPEFKNKAFFKYGCKVVQGMLTETQQQLELAQLLELQERFGPIFPIEEVVEAMTIQNKDRIIEKMLQNQKQQQEMAQQRAQLEMQQLQVDNETKLAYAESQKGLAAERIAKIQTDKAVGMEKIRRSQEEETASMLNVVKSLKEIQGMDTSNIREKIGILNDINAIQFEETLTPTEELQ